MNLRNKKKLIFSLLFFGAFYFGTNDTFAQCRCEPRLAMQEHFQKADVVFIGKVVEAEKIDPKDNENFDTIIVKFEVIQTWKQDLEKLVTVKELYGNIGGLEPNAELLLYM